MDLSAHYVRHCAEHWTLWHGSNTVPDHKKCPIMKINKTYRHLPQPSFHPSHLAFICTSVCGKNEGINLPLAASDQWRGILDSSVTCDTPSSPNTLKHPWSINTKQVTATQTLMSGACTKLMTSALSKQERTNKQRKSGVLLGLRTRSEHRDTEYQEVPCPEGGAEKEHESPPYSHSQEKGHDEDSVKKCARQGYHSNRHTFWALSMHRAHFISTRSLKTHNKPDVNIHFIQIENIEAQKCCHLLMTAQPGREKAWFPTQLRFLSLIYHHQIAPYFLEVRKESKTNFDPLFPRGTEFEFGTKQSEDQPTLIYSCL